MGSSIISSVISTFDLPPLLNSKMSANNTESWAEESVTSCYPFTSGRNRPHSVFKLPLALELKSYSGTGTIFGRYRGRTRAFQLLFLAFRFRQDDKMTSREASHCTKFVGSSSCCLSNGGRILRTFGQLF